MKLPSVSQIARLLQALKKDIADDYRASDDPADTLPGMCVTIGADDDGAWTYQTGDNSYSGGCYGMPYWAVVYLYRRSNSRALACDVVDQIAEAQYE